MSLHSLCRTKQHSRRQTSLNGCMFALLSGHTPGEPPVHYFDVLLAMPGKSFITQEGGPILQDFREFPPNP